MEKKLETLYELCEIVSRELEECNEKVRKAGGKLSPGDVEYLDKLTHMMKSLKTTIAMMESEGDEDGYSSRGNYSNRFMPWYGGMSYERGGSSNRGGSSYEGGSSYARGGRGGRGGNNPTGRNQYSREGGYSYAEDMEATREEIRELSMKMPEEHRRKIERALDELR